MTKEKKNEADNSDIREMLDDYLNTFQERSVDKAFGHYHIPMTLSLPDSFMTLASEDDVRGFLKSQFDMMGSQDYGSSSWSEMHIHRLHDNSAIASTLVHRFDKDGNVIVESGSTYLMAKIDGDWKILSLIAHDPSTIVRN